MARRSSGSSRSPSVVEPEISAKTIVTSRRISLSRVVDRVGSRYQLLAGLVGAALLLVSGVFLSTKARALKSVLDEIAKRGADQPAPTLAPPPLIAALPLINTGIALGVVFDMVMKPASVLVALGVVAIGILISAAAAMRRPAPVPSGVRTT